MATLQQNIALDSTTLTTFRAWAGATTYAAGLATAGGIAYALYLMGWIQSGDTGQVVWIASSLTLTQVTVTGGNSVYSFSALTGPAPRVGMSVTITGFVTGGNNVTGTVIAVSGVTSGTFTLATTTQANETHAGTAATTALAANPGSGTTVYEIWKMADALQATAPCFMKIEYGNGAAASSPNIFVTFGVATDGAGSISGTNASAKQSILTGGTGNDTTARPCYFSGSTGRFAMALNVTDGSSVGKGCFLNVERSHDASGNDTSTYYTYCIFGKDAGAGSVAVRQQSIVTGVAGVPPTVELKCVAQAPNAPSTWTYNGTTAVAVVSPVLGVIGNPLLGFLIGKVSDWLDQSQVPVTIYALAHTYLALSGPTFGQGSAWIAITSTVCPLMRYE